jgi:hypothetical protein
VPSNFPDEVWNRLKAWAKNQAHGGCLPERDECLAVVERIAREITGRAGALRPDVVLFYASETADMAAKFRMELLAAAGDGEAQAR